MVTAFAILAMFLWSLLLNNKVGKLSLFSNWLRENAISGECSTRNVASGMGSDISGCYAAKNDDVLKWSPSGPHVFPKWSTCDLSVSYLISLKHLLFENIAHDGPGCTWLYLAVLGCTRLYLAVSCSAFIFHYLPYHRLLQTSDACPTLPRLAKWRKPAGRSGAKLTADSIDTPFHYGHKWCLKGRKSRNLFILLCVQIVTIFFTEIPFKS